jgi:hypothetical protein
VLKPKSSAGMAADPSHSATGSTHRRVKGLADCRVQNSKFKLLNQNRC